jgi:hypothetical protein
MIPIGHGVKSVFIWFWDVLKKIGVFFFTDPRDG